MSGCHEECDKECINGATQAWTVGGLQFNSCCALGAPIGDLSLPLMNAFRHALLLFLFFFLVDQPVRHVADEVAWKKVFGALCPCRSYACLDSCDMCKRAGCRIGSLMMPIGAPTELSISPCEHLANKIAIGVIFWAHAIISNISINTAAMLPAPTELSISP